MPGVLRLALPVRQETALDSVSRSPNGFLSSLAADDFELIRPHLRTADLVQDMVLVEVDETLKRAYLPHRGVISLVVKLARGEHVQIAMIGRDSIFGAFSALGDPVALNSAVVLVPGVASTIDSIGFARRPTRARRSAPTLVRHGLAVYAQIQQTAGCNASHTVESRLARCLLHTRDLSGSDKLVLTQEAMAQMIGARRNSVSLVANTLQQANFIHYSRGHIEITNLDGLIKTSCECYATVKAQYDQAAASAHALAPDRCRDDDAQRRLTRHRAAVTRAIAQSPPYNYGQARLRGDLCAPELTRCSRTPDSCHGADGCEFEKSIETLSLLRAFTRVRLFAICAELKTWPLICRCRSWWSMTTAP